MQRLNRLVYDLTKNKNLGSKGSVGTQGSIIDSQHYKRKNH